MRIPGRAALGVAIPGVAERPEVSYRERGRGFRTVRWGAATALSPTLFRMNARACGCRSPYPLAPTLRRGDSWPGSM
jgi:hypothetical protein